MLVNTVSVVISAYNYKDHIDRAIDSALAQTLRPLDIIIVDDGSTDGTAEHVRTRYADQPIIRLIQQSNQGQLAAFVTGFRASRGDVLALLDPDDRWPRHKLETCLAVYRRHRDVDFVCSNLRFTGLRSGLYYDKERTRWVGPSVLMGLFEPTWLGAVTSSITVRRDLAARLLDIPDELLPYGKVGADMWLAGGADILNGRKFYIDEPLVDYHFHGRNDSLENVRTEKRLAMRLTQARLIDFYRTKAHLPATLDAFLLKSVKDEFRSKPQPSVFEWRAYAAMIRRSGLPFGKRLEQRFALTRHYYKGLWHARRLRAGDALTASPAFAPAASGPP